MEEFRRHHSMPDLSERDAARMRVSGAMMIRLSNCSLPICTGVKSGCRRGWEILFNIRIKNLSVHYPAMQLPRRQEIFCTNRFIKR
jgi:hypothetical protein